MGIEDETWGLAPKDNWEIWSEGFRITGGWSGANYIGHMKGKTFKEAILNWFEMWPDPSFNAETLTLWGCSLYPTEQEARKSFG